jgi:hypothetical protein
LPWILYVALIDLLCAWLKLARTWKPAMHTHELSQAGHVLGHHVEVGACMILIGAGQVNAWEPAMHAPGTIERSSRPEADPADRWSRGGAGSRPGSGPAGHGPGEPGGPAGQAEAGPGRTRRKPAWAQPERAAGAGSPPSVQFFCFLLFFISFAS